LNDIIAMQKAIVERFGFQGSTQGGGLPIESRLNIENHNHYNQEITKTQERTGVVYVGPKNGGGIVMAATKPHKSHVDAKSNAIIGSMWHAS
jgi:hypothetical protein